MKSPVWSQAGREGSSQDGFQNTLDYFCVNFNFSLLPYLNYHPTYILKNASYVQDVCPRDHNCTCHGDNIVTGTGRECLVSQLAFNFSLLLWIPLIAKTSFQRIIIFLKFHVLWFHTSQLYHLKLPTLNSTSFPILFFFSVEWGSQRNDLQRKIT